MTLHVPSKTFHSREFWWCEGLLHKHRSLVKAQECEQRRAGHER